MDENGVFARGLKSRFIGTLSASSAIVDMQYRLISNGSRIGSAAEASFLGPQPLTARPDHFRLELPDDVEIKRISAIFFERLWPM